MRNNAEGTQRSDVVDFRMRQGAEMAAMAIRDHGSPREALDAIAAAEAEFYAEASPLEATFPSMGAQAAYDEMKRLLELAAGIGQPLFSQPDQEA